MNRRIEDRYSSTHGVADAVGAEKPSPSNEMPAELYEEVRERLGEAMGALPGANALRERDGYVEPRR